MSRFATNPNGERSRVPMGRGLIAGLGRSAVVATAVRLTVMQAAALLLLLVPFGPQARAQFRDVLVFADASLRSALDDANNLFRFENGSGTVMSYGTSPALAKEIEGGKPADVFIAAGLEAMDYVAERKLVQADTREKFLGDKLVLIARADSPAALTIAPSFPLAQSLGSGRLAMADATTIPAGKYGKAALENLGVWASVADKIATAPDARAALLLVTRGEAALGIVSQTDALADKSVKILASFPEGSHPPIIYQIAILTNSANGVAPIYVQYLLSPKAEPFFEKRGFVVY